MKTMPIPARFRAMIKDGPDIDLAYTNLAVTFKREQKRLDEIAKREAEARTRVTPIKVRKV